MRRVILHCDLNSFFASVEELYHPEYKMVPMAVGGSVEERHGIILAKNQCAKKYKIQTAEPLWQAKQKCPHLVIVPPSYDKYSYFSKRVRMIFQEYTDLIEPFGIDEAWLDVTGSQKLFGDGQMIADSLRRRIKEELGITASVGVSFNKVFAKLGSDYKKPDATTVISYENYREILFPLPVESLLYVGKRAMEQFHQSGIYTIGQLAMCDCVWLEGIMGKAGVMLWRFANGLDDDEVKEWGYHEQAKSISHGMTTRRDLRNVQDVKMVLMAMAEQVAMDMRAQKVVARKVCLFMRDIHLRTFQRQCVLKKKTQCMQDILDAAMDLLYAHYSFEIPLRSVGIRVMDLEDEQCHRQLSLFEDAIVDVKKEQLEKTVDLIRKRYGFGSIKRGTMMMDTDIFEGDDYENKS